MANKDKLKILTEKLESNLDLLSTKVRTSKLLYKYFSILSLNNRDGLAISTDFKILKEFFLLDETQVTVVAYTDKYVNRDNSEKPTNEQLIGSHFEWNIVSEENCLIKDDKKYLILTETFNQDKMNLICAKGEVSVNKMTHLVRTTSTFPVKLVRSSDELVNKFIAFNAEKNFTPSKIAFNKEVFKAKINSIILQASNPKLSRANSVENGLNINKQQKLPVLKPQENNIVKNDEINKVNNTSQNTTTNKPEILPEQPIQKEKEKEKIEDKGKDVVEGSNSKVDHGDNIADTTHTDDENSQTNNDKEVLEDAC